MQDKDSLDLVPINDLLDEKYFVASYQRGYRWNSDQVEALLNDVWDFEEESEYAAKDEIAPFYCLQPIVTKDKLVDGVLHKEVIDGQQRLTTILIILFYFNQTEFKKPKRIFSLTYETREDSAYFLTNITNEKLAKTNIDYHHIHSAYKAIDEWFSDREKGNDAIRGDFHSVLINKVKVINYDVSEGSFNNEIDVFTRLNIGKIQLTNAELIRALFLQRSNFEDDNVNLKQIQIASEWDAIEKTLQDDSFWYFIYNPKKELKYENRIEFIFDLMESKKKGDDDNHTFYKFYNKFSVSKKDNHKPDIESIWLEVKHYFMSFEEWHIDRELYHLIGFLVEFGKEGVRELKEKGNELTKTKFKQSLRETICGLLSFNRDDKIVTLDDLSYDNNKDHLYIRMYLLLFNIQTILSTKETDIRFPFDKYKEGKWDIEHIRSQTDKSILTQDRESWLMDVFECLTGIRLKLDDEVLISIIAELEEEKREHANLIRELLIAETINEEKFQSLYNGIEILFKENNEAKDKDGIGNLALLDSATNRSYGNAMFPIKRKTINQNDMKGVFVPICTKNVFLKSYSKNPEGMYWNDSDAKDYLKAMKLVLKEFLPEMSKGNE